MLARGGRVGDAPAVAEAAAPRRHPFAVLTAVDDDRVARPRLGGSPIDRPEGVGLGAGARVGPGRRDVEGGCHRASILDSSSRESRGNRNSAPVSAEPARAWGAWA